MMDISSSRSMVLRKERLTRSTTLRRTQKRTNWRVSPRFVSVRGEQLHNDTFYTGQIMKFAKEHPTEILIFKIKFDGLNSEELKRTWAETAWNLLGERLL